MRVVTRATGEAQRHERLFDVPVCRRHKTETLARRVAIGASTLAPHILRVATACAVVVAYHAKRRVVVVTEVVGVVVNDVRTKAAVKMHPAARTQRRRTVKEGSGSAYVILRGTGTASRHACKPLCGTAAATSGAWWRAAVGVCRASAHVRAVVRIIAIVVVIGRRCALPKRHTISKTAESPYEGGDSGLNSKSVDAKDEGEHQGVGAGHVVMRKPPRREVSTFGVVHRKAIVGVAITQPAVDANVIEVLLEAWKQVDLWAARKLVSAADKVDIESPSFGEQVGEEPPPNAGGRWNVMASGRNVDRR